MGLVSQQIQSAVAGVTLAALTLLVSLGVIGPDQVDAWQAVVIAVLTLVGVVGVRSALPPRDAPRDAPPDAPPDAPAEPAD